MVQNNKKKLVFICSPFRGREKAENVAMARRACRHAIDTDCTPIAPHLLYPQFLNDEGERNLGIAAGLQLLEHCDEVWVVGNRITEGMSKEIAKAAEAGIPIKNIPDPRVAEEHLLDAIFGGKEYKNE